MKLQIHATEITVGPEKSVKLIIEIPLQLQLVDHLIMLIGYYAVSYFIMNHFSGSTKAIAEQHVQYLL